MPRTARTARKPAQKTARMIAEETLRAELESYLSEPSGLQQRILVGALEEYRGALIDEILAASTLRPQICDETLSTSRIA